MSILDNAPRQYRFILGGQDVLNYIIAAEGDGELDVVPECTVLFNRNIKELFSFDQSTENLFLEVWRGINNANERRIFFGLVKDFKVYPPYVKVIFSNKYYIAQKSIAKTSFDRNIDPEEGIISEIYKSLIARYTTLVADNTTVVNTGTILRRNKFLCDYDQVYERAEELAKDINYQHYHNDHEDKCFFEPRGFIDTDVVLRVGENIVKQPEWDYNFDGIFNAVTIIGSPQKVEITQYFSGDNTEGQNFQLRYTPTSMKVFVGTGSFDPDTGNKPSNNAVNERLGGKKGSTAGDFDYIYDADEKVRRVYFKATGETQPSFTPPSGTNNIEIQYTYDVPVIVFGRNKASIDKYTKRETEIKKLDIDNLNDAELYLQTYLEQRSIPFISTNLLLLGRDDIRIGRLYTVVDEKNNIERKVLVKKIKWFFPYAPDEIDVGDRAWREADFSVTVWDRLKRLEEKDSRTSELLIQIFPFDGTNTVYESRDFELRRRNTAGGTLWDMARWDENNWSDNWSNGFILGSAISGILGTNSLGSSGDVEILVRRTQGQGVYKEFLYDDYYFDDVRSDAEVVWDTTENEIIIPPQKTLYTKSLELNSRRTQATILFPTLTIPAHITIQITYDNINWITVTDGQTVTFPTPATDIRLRLINTGDDA